MHISIKMSLMSTAISVSLCFIISLIFGLFNYFRADWITFGSQSYGVQSLEDHWIIVPEYEYSPSTLFISASLGFSFDACLFCVCETIAVTKRKFQNKNSQEQFAFFCFSTFIVVVFFISVICNVIGLAIWTHEICNGSFSKEHFSGEHCSNFNWNFSYFAGWISTVFLLFCTICSCCWRQFVK